MSGGRNQTERALCPNLSMRHEYRTLNEDDVALQQCTSKDRGQVFFRLYTEHFMIAAKAAARYTMCT